MDGERKGSSPALDSLPSGIVGGNAFPVNFEDTDPGHATPCACIPLFCTEPGRDRLLALFSQTIQVFVCAGGNSPSDRVEIGPAGQLGPVSGVADVAALHKDRRHSGSQ